MSLFAADIATGRLGVVRTANCSGRGSALFINGRCGYWVCGRLNVGSDIGRIIFLCRSASRLRETIGGMEEPRGVVDRMVGARETVVGLGETRAVVDKKVGAREIGVGLEQLRGVVDRKEGARELGMLRYGQREVTKVRIELRYSCCFLP